MIMRIYWSQECLYSESAFRTYNSNHLNAILHMLLLPYLMHVLARPQLSSCLKMNIVTQVHYIPVF